ncbi:type II secretion system F family protein [Aliarcobacter skirrowii]|uniref:type II secretion system F family protein n=1 Tax=Aliarcobacter skirrowii TaxID=28200 RepID=UPI0029B8B4DA|nr:type II secretion system F family protein [Aliarcobacter skirrowii]MDX4064050.1 type II secretion system F family protein [Aliarcobacter skirrowii]
MSLFKDPYEMFLLDYLVTKLETGSNTRRALVLYSDQITKKTAFKKRLLSAIRELETGKQKLEEVLYKYKFLNTFQYSIVSNSTSTVEGLKLVLSFTKGNPNLMTKMLGPIFLPLSIIIGSFYSLILYLGFLKADVEYLTKLNPDVEQFLGIPKYFTYTFAYWGLAISILITLFIFFYYMYTEKYKPAWLYKIFKTQAYSDGRYLFRILNGMLSAGISFHKTSAILANEYFKPGLRPFFKDLAIMIEKNKKLFMAFDKYNFPTLLTAEIRLAELSKSNYSELAKTLYKTCDTMYEKNINYLVLQWKFFFWLVAMLVTVVIGSDIINLVIATFTFKTLYQ